MRRPLKCSLLLGAILFATAINPASAAGVTRKLQTRIHVEAANLDCDFRGEQDCVNVATTLVWDVSTGRGTFCVDVGDFHADHPAVAHGCAPVTAREVSSNARTGFTLQPTAIQAVRTEDCFNSDPAEGCVPRNVDLVATLTVAPLSVVRRHRSEERRMSDGCRIRTREWTSVRNATVTLTVDGFVYRLPNLSRDPHTAFARLTVIRTRVKTSC